MSNLVFKILNDNGDIEITRFAKAEAVFKNPEYINEIFTEKKYINIFEMGKENEKLQQENKQLKELINGIREERDYLFNKSSVENKQIQQEKDLYKSVIEEVREYTEELKPHWLGNDLVLKIIDDLLQILDKGVKDEK